MSRSYNSSPPSASMACSGTALLLWEELKGAGPTPNLKYTIVWCSYIAKFITPLTPLRKLIFSLHFVKHFINRKVFYIKSVDINVIHKILGRDITFCLLIFVPNFISYEVKTKLSRYYHERGGIARTHSWPWHYIGANGQRDAPASFYCR
jgi:hypothetical protein